MNLASVWFIIMGWFGLKLAMPESRGEAKSEWAAASRQTLTCRRRENRLFQRRINVPRSFFSSLSSHRRSVDFEKTHIGFCTLLLCKNVGRVSAHHLKLPFRGPKPETLELTSAFSAADFFAKRQPRKWACGASVHQTVDLLQRERESEATGSEENKNQVGLKREVYVVYTWGQVFSPSIW